MEVEVKTYVAHLRSFEIIVHVLHVGFEIFVLSFKVFRCIKK
jgi:hypothetical protein